MSWEEAKVGDESGFSAALRDSASAEHRQSTPRKLHFPNDSTPSLHDASELLSNNSQAVLTALDVLGENARLLASQKKSEEDHRGAVAVLKRGALELERRVQGMDDELHDVAHLNDSAHLTMAEMQQLYSKQVEELERENRNLLAQNEECVGQLRAAGEETEKASGEAERWRRRYEESASACEAQRKLAEAEASQIRRHLEEQMRRNSELHEQLDKLGQEKQRMSEERRLLEASASAESRAVVALKARVEELRLSELRGRQASKELAALVEERDRLKKQRDEANHHANASLAKADSAQLNLQRKTEEVKHLKQEMSLGVGTSIKRLEVTMQQKDAEIRELKQEVEKYKARMGAVDGVHAAYEKQTAMLSAKDAEIQRLSAQPNDALAAAKKDVEVFRSQLVAAEAKAATQLNEFAEWKANAEAQYSNTVDEYETKLNRYQGQLERRFSYPGQEREESATNLTTGLGNTSLWDLIPSPIQHRLAELKSDTRKIQRIVEELKGTPLDERRLSAAFAAPLTPAPSPKVAAPVALSFEALERRLSLLSDLLPERKSPGLHALMGALKDVLRCILIRPDAQADHEIRKWVMGWKENETPEKPAPLAAQSQTEPGEHSPAKMRKTEQKMFALRTENSELRSEIVALKSKEPEFAAAISKVERLSSKLRGSQEEARSLLERQAVLEAESETLREQKAGLREWSASRAAEAASRKEEAEEAMRLLEEGRAEWERGKEATQTLHDMARATIEDLGRQVATDRALQDRLRAQLTQAHKDREAERRRITTLRAEGELRIQELTIFQNRQTDAGTYATGAKMRELKSELAISRALEKGLLFQVAYLKDYELSRFATWQRNNPAAFAGYKLPTPGRFKSVVLMVVAVNRWKALERKHRHARHTPRSAAPPSFRNLHLVPQRLS